MHRLLEHWLSYYYLRLISLAFTSDSVSGFFLLLASVSFSFLIYVQAFLLQVSTSLHLYCVTFLESVLYMTSMIWFDASCGDVDFVSIVYTLSCLGVTTECYIGLSFWGSIRVCLCVTF